MGTGDFAVPSLDAVHRAGHEISLVVSQPDRPQGRGLELKGTPVKTAAVALGLPVFQPDKLRADPGPVIAQKADVLVVVAYGQILREDVLGGASRGAVNLHASLLPKYRGAAPIQWAIANGDALTGVTTMQLDRGMDTGPILLQEPCPIEADDTTATLEPKLARIGARLLISTLEGLSHGTLRPRLQEDAAATRAPLIKKTDGRIDFQMTATQIRNRLRGLSPWPGLFFTHGGRSIKLLAADVAQGPSAVAAIPGTVLVASREGLEVACGSGSILRLLRVQPESRSGLSAHEFADAAKVRPGVLFNPAAD